MDAGPPPPCSTLRVELSGGIGQLVLDRPEQLNPISSVTLREVAGAASWFDRTDAVAVIVRGEGRAFSAGFDTQELSRGGDADTPALGAAMAAAVRNMRALTVASVQGPCVGGGLVLALACDLRVASRAAWFSLPEAELGIPLAWSGVPLLVRELGPARTLDLVLTCRQVGAAEAATLGLVSHLVDGPDALPRAEELAQLVAQRVPEVVWATTRQVGAVAEEMVPARGEWAGTALLVDAIRRLERGS